MCTGFWLEWGLLATTPGEARQAGSAFSSSPLCLQWGLHTCIFSFSPRSCSQPLVLGRYQFSSAQGCSCLLNAGLAKPTGENLVVLFLFLAWEREGSAIGWCPGWQGAPEVGRQESRHGVFQAMRMKVQLWEEKRWSR